MDYTAGVSGFGPGPLTSPYWSCPCGRFRFAARAMPHRKAGNNKVEAERAFSTHLHVFKETT